MPPESTGLMPPYWDITLLVQVQRPREVHGAGSQAEAPGPSNAAAQRRDERQRHQQRGQGNPGDRRVSEAGETEREQQA